MSNDEVIEVPMQSLSPDALQGLIESFVLREGTEYGWHDISLEAKVARVREQLRRKEARIVFNKTDETIDIVPGN